MDYRRRSMSGTGYESYSSSRRSSFSSDGGGSEGRRAPPLQTTGRRVSMVDQIEQERRGTVATPKLKGLQLPTSSAKKDVDSGPASLPATSIMSPTASLPTIASMPKLHSNLQTLPLSRRSSFQALLPKPFKAPRHSSESSATETDRRSSATLPLKATHSVMTSFSRSTNVNKDDHEGKENLFNGFANENKSGGQKSSSGVLASSDTFRDQSNSQTNGLRSPVNFTSSSAYSPTPYAKPSLFNYNHSSTPEDVPEQPQSLPPSVNLPRTSPPSVPSQPQPLSPAGNPMDTATLSPAGNSMDTASDTRYNSRSSNHTFNFSEQDSRGSVSAFSTALSPTSKAPASPSLSFFNAGAQLRSPTSPNRPSPQTLPKPSMKLKSPVSAKSEPGTDRYLPMDVQVTRTQIEPEVTHKVITSTEQPIVSSQSVPTSMWGTSTRCDSTSHDTAEQWAPQLPGSTPPTVTMVTTGPNNTSPSPVVTQTVDDQILIEFDVAPTMPSSLPPTAHSIPSGMRSSDLATTGPSTHASTPLIPRVTAGEDLTMTVDVTTGDLLGLELIGPSSLTTSSPTQTLDLSTSYDSLLDEVKVDPPAKTLDCNGTGDSADELDKIGRAYSPRRPGSGRDSRTHSREDLSEGRGSLQGSPTIPLSPTPSDADSGIYSTRPDHKSDNESLTSKDTSPAGTWKSDRFPHLGKNNLSHDVTIREATKLESVPQEAAPASKLPGGLLEVEMEKGQIGLGFCIEGGKSSPLGDRPIKIKRLFKGDTPAQRVLQQGDEILQVNDKDISQMTHFTAWNYLKALNPGVIRFMIRRQ